MATDGPVFSELPRKRLNLSQIESFNSCSLKRKRPPKIQIPNVLREISTDIFNKCAEIKQADDCDDLVSFSDNGVGVFSLKGKKKFMEDSYKVFTSGNGTKKFFGVYDGHGGSKAAEFVAENLHLNVFQKLDGLSDSKDKEEAVKDAYLRTDEEFLKQDVGSGVCCVTALIEGNKMVVSNLGDCRAVLSRNGKAEELTNDHRPTREDERRRIEDNGGYVEFHRGTWRVHGTLAVSRGIGDAHLKKWVISEPDTKVICLDKDMEYLILASDGLWEEVSSQEAIDVVMKSCSSDTQEFVKSPVKNCNTYASVITSPVSKSPRISLVMPKRKLHPASHKQERTEEDEFCDENGSPPSKCRRVSLSAKQMKFNSHFPDRENGQITEKQGCNALLAASNKLVDLAVARGCLDDITVMIVDLNCFKN